MQTGNDLETNLEQIFREVDTAIAKANTGGELFGGAKVAEICQAHYDDEDANTFTVMVDLADGRTACICVCPGMPVSAIIVT